MSSEVQQRLIWTRTAVSTQWRTAPTWEHVSASPAMQVQCATTKQFHCNKSGPKVKGESCWQNNCASLCQLWELYMYLLPCVPSSLLPIPIHSWTIWMSEDSCNFWLLKCIEASCMQQVHNYIWKPVGSQNHYKLSIKHGVSNTAFMHTHVPTQEKKMRCITAKFCPL